MMIDLPNIDGKIWNLEYKTAEIISMMLQQQPFEIHVRREGPCAESLGLYHLLDELCSRFNFDKKNITIVTSNQIEKHKEYNIKKLPPLYVPATQNYIKKNQHDFKNKTFDQNFKSFGLLIGRSNAIRLELASKVFNQYKDKTALTFHYDWKNDYHREHLGFDNLMLSPHTDSDLDCVLDLIKASPIVSQEIQEVYPFPSPAHFNISKIYHTFFVEIVCETYYSGNSFYPTEKIWRPLALKTPFIVQGPRNYYKNLHRMGFKTFDQWWDEGFDEDSYDCHNQAILEILKNLSKLSVQELKKMHDEMQEILDHNYHVFMNFQDHQFQKIFNE